MLIFTSGIVFSQEIIPNKSEFQLELKSNAKHKYYKGYIVNLNSNCLVRFRTYGRSNIQSSFIYEIHNINIRLYYYFNITNYNFTPAISIKLII